MDLRVILGAAGACLAGGFLPWINSEVVVVGAAVLTPAEGLPVLVLACTAAQMLAKCSLYAITRWAPDKLPQRAQKLLAKVEKFRERRKTLALTVVLSSLVGLPPFYLVTLACGTLRVPFALFGIGGFTGTAIRYGALAWGAEIVTGG